MVSNFLLQAMQGEPLTVYGDGSQTRSLCYVEDEVRGLLALLDSDLTGPVNIGNPDETTVLELARTVIALFGSVLGDRAPSAADRRPHPAPPGHLPGVCRPGMGARDRLGGRPGEDRGLPRRGCRGVRPAQSVRTVGGGGAGEWRRDARARDRSSRRCLNPTEQTPDRPAGTPPAGGGWSRAGSPSSR